MADLNTVLRHEPGNALTLYNRSLIYMQVGEMEKALEDIDRVININPDNVLAHFNRAAIFANLERWEDALADYDKSIELYPDFARAYMNRSYVKSMMGRFREADSDYRTAQEKIREYRESSQAGSFADTTRKYSSLLAFDADFAQENFDNELLQNRNVDIRLKPLYRFTLAAGRDEGTQALSKEYENALIDRFRQVMPVPVEIRSETVPAPATYVASTCAEEYFAKGLQDLQDKKFNSALEWFDKAVESADDEQARDKYSRYYKAFYLMNRGVLKAEMIDFIASLEGNVQTLSMDTQGGGHSRHPRSSRHTARHPLPLLRPGQPAVPVRQHGRGHRELRHGHTPAPLHGRRLLQPRAGAHIPPRRGEGLHRPLPCRRAGRSRIIQRNFKILQR